MQDATICFYDKHNWNVDITKLLAACEVERVPTSDTHSTPTLLGTPSLYQAPHNGCYNTVLTPVRDCLVSNQFALAFTSVLQLLFSGFA